MSWPQPFAWPNERGVAPSASATQPTVGRMFESTWDAGLDDAQLAAATHGDGPLVVVAGAGTGKTRTLVARVAALVDRGVDPERILLLTFTRRAADEMLARAGATCDRRDAARKLTGGTFHAVGYRVVAAHAQTLGLAAEPSVLDTSDARDLIDLLRHEAGLTGTGQRMPRAETLLDIYSRAVNTATSPRDVITEQFPWCEPHVDAILDLFRAYVARKRSRSLLDFDDLLLCWRALLIDPALGAALAARYDHVLVDEYQDVNQVQVDIVRHAAPGRHRPDRGRRRRAGDLWLPRLGQPAPDRTSPRNCPARGPCAWNGTSGRASRSCALPTPSVPSPAASGSSCGPTATVVRGHAWCAATTRPRRRARWSTRYSRRPKQAARCASRPCSCARRTTATCSRSS